MRRHLYFLLSEMECRVLWHIKDSEGYIYMHTALNKINQIKESEETGSKARLAFVHVFMPYTLECILSFEGSVFQLLDAVYIYTPLSFPLWLACFLTKQTDL